MNEAHSTSDVQGSKFDVQPPTFEVRRSPLGLLTIFITCTLASAPLQAQDRFEEAYYAWDAGKYVEALETFEQILTGPAADQYHRDIALTTGELFRTTDVAPDGTAPVWSPDGQWIAYEVVTDSGRTTHLVRRDELGSSGRVLNGHGLTFSPNTSHAVFISLEQGSALETARAELRSRIQVSDFGSFRRLQREMSRIEAEHSRVRIMDLRAGSETTPDIPGVGVHEIRVAEGGTVYFIGHDPLSPEDVQVYSNGANGGPRKLTDTPGSKENLAWAAPGLLGYVADGDMFALLNTRTGDRRTIRGSSFAFSADGSTAAFLRDTSNTTIIFTVALAGEEEPVAVYHSENDLANPAVSPSGARLVWQEMVRENWELMTLDRADREARRLTWEVQHDLFPRFLDEDLVFAVIGEGRHRRSFIHEFTTGERTKVFHNNTVRTVAPEYEWSVSPDASAVLIVSERDGDTISPERGVYLTQLNAQISRDELLNRVRANLDSERSLRANGMSTFAPIADQVRAVVADVTTARIYGYAKDLHAFGSKFITEPGNARAIEYITATLESFGYDPELQWFEPRPGIQSANIIATLRGTVDPELIYVVSSHFDSVNRGPGADDNSSGTTALLEAARVLSRHPQPATIQFAFFTGEEAGLLGSREFVRRAVAAGEKIVGALNNDMIGYANTHRLDNTIRYSNAGIRDIQHAAAFLFTDLITYDAKYYKSTDAHAYYEAYGDIVGGIGSYPILGNPHYHQSHDVLETINQQLVAEVSKTTVASLMLLASSPSRLKDVTVAWLSNRATVSWTPAPESGIDHYVVRFGDRETTTRDARITLEGVSRDQPIAVKAIRSNGLAGWDWAYPEN